ncbi:DUF4080 domain-containing protein [Thermodesulfobacteriota bacterium]
MKPLLYKLIALNARYTHSCLALFYLRSELEENLPDCSPEIVQYTINDPYYPLLRRIGGDNPEALFFSVYIWNSSYMQRLLNDLVKILPETPFILGGPQAGALAQNLPPQVFLRCSFFYGEIEGVGKSFYHDLAEGRLQREYTGRKTKAFKNPYRKSDFAGPLLNRQIYYESSRGCPFGCTYCLSASEKGVRHLQPEQVFDEIKSILQYSPKVIRFVDRTFNDLPERALKIWRFLAEQPGDTLFHFEMAPDRFTEEMFQFLQQVSPGRFQFEIGVQSTNRETLQAINRQCDQAKLEHNILQLVSLDTIHLHLDLILGLPYENRESFSRSFADVFLLGPHYIQMGLLKILPDAPISRSKEEYGLVVCENPPYELLANRWLDKSELGDLFWLGECVEAFYNTRFFRNLWNYLRRIQEDIFVFFEVLLEVCRGKGFFDLAPTQELMSSLLLECAQSRSDKELVRELLVFDWLRCGHRFLPEHLDQEHFFMEKKFFWKKMPQNWAGVYDYKTRDEFFKQGVFVRFSANLLKETGLSDDTKPGYVSFQAGRENKIFKFNRIVFIPESVLEA